MAPRKRNDSKLLVWGDQRRTQAFGGLIHQEASSKSGLPQPQPSIVDESDFDAGDVCMGGTAVSPDDSSPTSQSSSLSPQLETTEGFENFLPDIDDDGAINEPHDAPLATYFVDLDSDADDEDTDEDTSTDDEDANMSSEADAPSEHGKASQESTSVHHTGIRDPSSPSSSPSSSSSSSSAESIRNPIPSDPVDPHLLALGLWLEKSGISRQHYARLREVLLMRDQLNDHNAESDLPLKLDTLKRYVRKHLLMLRLLRKAIRVIFEKQATLPAQEKGKSDTVRIERKTWIYWYNPIDLVKTILSTTALTNLMQFGMADIVDEPTEYYHSRGWGSSNLTTSGEFAHTSEGDIILVGDVVRIAKEASQEGFSKARVYFVGKDARRTSDTFGQILISVQPILGPQDVDTLEELSQHIGYVAAHELIIWEDHLIVLTPRDILHHLDVIIDGEWLEGEEVGGTPDTPWYIKRCYSATFQQVRPLRRTPPLRGELELNYFGREQLQRLATPEDGSYDVRSFPIILFIDDFGVHRSMYRALKAFYWIPAALPFDERRKVANVFTLTLGPHGADVDDIISTFRKASEALLRGIFLDVNGRRTLVCAFIIVMIGDMPQQADNSGFMRHTAQVGCRSCFCEKVERPDLDFDIRLAGRYHWDTVFDREEGLRLAGPRRRNFFNNLGMRVEEAPYTKLAPYLDLIRSRAWDAPHSEWRGLGRVLQALLLQEILTKAGAKAYLQELQSFPFPPKWPRLQSPLHYIWSWSLSEAGRATLLTPLILRCRSQTSWFKHRYVQEFDRLERPVRGGNNASVTDNIIRAYAIVAIANSVTGSQVYTPSDTIQSCIYHARHAYQCLLQTAHCAQGRASRPRNAEENDYEARETLERILEQDDPEVTNDGQQSDHSDGLDEAQAGGRTRRKSKYIRLQALPNVHAGLHLVDNVNEYSTVMNCSVLPGELKHKGFIRSADKASPSNLMAFLFACDATRQSIRLGLGGAWAHEYPVLRAPVDMVHTYCPRLVRSFVPVSEQDDEDDLQEGFLDNVEDEDDETQVREDRAHRQVSASVKGFCLTREHRNDFHLSPHTNMRQQGAHLSLFYRILRAAFDTDYGLHGIVNFHDRRLRWKQRLAFTDSIGKRHVYNVGDYFRLTSTERQFGRLRQIFIVYFERKPFLFLLADTVTAVFDDNTPMQDHILDLLVFDIGHQFICGLPSLDPGHTLRRPYFVTAPRHGVWDGLVDEEEDGSREFVLQCHWQLDCV